MIEQQTSADRLNEIVNHPSVHPWVCGPIEGAVDLTAIVESKVCTALLGEHGGFIFYDLGNGVFDAHSAILPEGRGKWAFRAARECLKIMFSGEAREITMAAPKGNLAVLSLIRSLKAKYRGTIENGWWLNGRAVSSDIYSLTKADWEQCLLQHH